jgi:hypothetical protein
MYPPYENRRKTEPPLWSIGLVVALMLIVPFVLYSMAPAGPIREGDTIFTDGTLKVPLAHPILYESTGFDGTCLLDPHDPLTVLRQPEDRIKGVIFAKVQGKTAIEWPFCPPQAEILLARSHIIQKADVWSEAGKRMLGWWP